MNTTQLQKMNKLNLHHAKHATFSQYILAPCSKAFFFSFLSSLKGRDTGEEGLIRDENPPRISASYRKF